MDQATACPEVFTGCCCLQVFTAVYLAAAGFAWRDGNREGSRVAGLCRVQEKAGGWMTAASAHASNAMSAWGELAAAGRCR